jgi:HK97 family phage portal protein
VSEARGAAWRAAKQARRELVEQHRAFPRDPTSANDTPNPAGTVGPETAPTTQLAAPAGAEPAVVDGDALEAALPGPRGLAPSPWAGWPSSWGTSWDNVGGGALSDPVMGRKVSTVFSCVDLNSNALGSMPVVVTQDGRPIDPEEHPWTENPDPRIYSGWDEFVVQWAASMYTRGEAFIYATRTSWETLLPDRFMVLDPDRVTVRFDNDGFREYELSGVGPLFSFDVLHSRYMTLAGWPNGLSPLMAAAGNLRSAAALEQYGANLAEGGGIPWGVLSTEQRLTPRQALLARQQYRAQRADMSGDPVVMGYGLSLDTLNLSPKDMALLELRVFDEQRIASVLGTPPWLVGLPQPSGMTYANALSLFGFHWRRLRPVAKRLTNGLSAWALPRGRRCQLNAGDYVQPDLAERAAAYRTMKDAGALTADEWRALENLPPMSEEQAEETRTGRASTAVANSTAGSAVTQ